MGSLAMYTALEKKGFDVELTMEDFPSWLLCVLLEDRIWALGSCVLGSRSGKAGRRVSVLAIIATSWNCKLAFASLSIALLAA